MAELDTIRVLHIMSGFGGGISSFIKNKAEALVGTCVQFDVVTYDECSAEFNYAIEATGGHIYRLVNPKKAGWSAFKSSFLSVLQANRYQVIHCHIDGYRVLPYKYLASKYHQGKFYIHAHLARNNQQLPFFQQLRLKLEQRLNRYLSDAYLGCGQLAIEASYGSKVPVNQMMMIPNSVNVDQFAIEAAQARQYRQSWRQHYQVDDATILIGQVARLMPIKNHRFTLALAKLAKQQQRPMKFILWGSGQLEAELKAQVAADPDLSQVIFAGRVADTGQVYPVLDCLILPSIQEGLPTVLVETQAAGLSAVVSDTITREVDLGMGLVTYLSTQADSLHVWLDTIELASQETPPDLYFRKGEVEAHNFSNETSAGLYLEFLQGRIHYYQLG